MAYGLKYRITFKTLQNDTCKVDIYIDDYVGSVINLEPAVNPFVLREFNTDDDIYKPLRPQQATINFISQAGVTIEDFLGNSDTYAYVAFEFLSVSQYYWYGYLLQDDFQETWQDAKHIITLRASEGLGLLQTQPLADNSGNELIGKYTPWELIQYAGYGTIQTFIEHKVINNLYHSSMDQTSDVPSIGQCYIDARTFSIGDGEYDNKYNVLEKINAAFSQTLLQYKGKWVIFRPEELYMTPAQSLRQFNVTLLGTTISNNRYDIEVGVNEDIKPIVPEMLRFINRPTKVDQINNYITFPSELFLNENFQRGTLLGSGSIGSGYGDYEYFSVNNWVNYTSTRESPVATGQQLRRWVYTDLKGFEYENFIEVQSSTAEAWAQSTEIQIKKGDQIEISFDWIVSIFAINTGSFPLDVDFNVLQILFRSIATPTVFKYGADKDGKWVYGANFDSASIPKITYNYPGTGSPVNIDFTWVNFSITTAPALLDGWLKLLFPNNNLFVPNTPCIKNLKVRYITSINGIGIDKIDGTFERFTKSQDIRIDFNKDIYLDDINNFNANGALYESDETTLCTPTWNRYRYPTESYPFKKQNLIANWERTRFHRNKIDVNLFGLKYGSEPIGLLNTIKFVDDDPNKLYYIANLKEIDFASATWQATLAEVYDNDRDFLINVSATYTNKTGSGLVPITLNYGQYFSVITGNKLRYTGVPTITLDFKCRVVGSITVSTTPVVVNFTLSSTTGVLKTVNITATTSPFAVDVDLDVDNVVLATNDEIELTLSASITSLTVTSSYLLFNNNDSIYPTYKSGYIFK
jgi:hypothetical protein